MSLESLIGNLFVLAAVIVILVVYRQLDKNNRSLDKIRKYADGVRDDLNAFVEERTAAVRDLEAVLKVHDKTGAEILKRIQALETGLLSRVPEIEQLRARLDSYAGSMTELETQTKRIDTHLERVKEETVFVDRVSQRIKSAGEQMTALEASFGQIRQEFVAVNQKDLETVRNNAFEVFEAETLEYVRKLAEAQQRVDGFEAFVNELESKKNSFVREAETALDAKTRDVLAAAEASLTDTARQAEDLSMVVFLKLEEKIENQAQETEKRLRGVIDEREAAIRATAEDLTSRLYAIDASVAERGVLLDSLGAKAEDAAAQLRANFESEQAQLLSMTAQLKTDLDAAVAEARQRASDESDAVRREFHSALEIDRQESQALVAEVRQLIDTTRHQVQEGERQAVDAIETRLTDYESGFAYRFTQLEQAQKDLTELDQNLRAAMEKTADKIQADFTAFDAAMAQRRQEEQTALEAKLGSARDSLAKLDQDLDELKARAYDNVSQKFQGVEEQFFADLQRRAASMAQSVEDWQSALNARFEELRQTSESARAETEQQASENLKTRVQELQTASFQTLDRLDRQIQEAQEAASRSVGTYRDEIETARARLTEELAELERGIAGRLSQDRARIELGATESLTRLERDLDAKLKAVGDELEKVKGDYKTGLDGAQAEFNLWQARFTQKFKELDAEFQEQQSLLRTTLAERINLLSDEFASQKEELIERSAEDRQTLRNDLAQIRGAIDELDGSLRSRSQAAIEAFTREQNAISKELLDRSADDRLALKNDLAQIRSSINELDGSLRSRSQAAIEAFSRSYDELSQELQKKNRDLTTDIEGHLREYRDAVADTREKAEALQKKAFAKIEDQSAQLNLTLEEIDKRQKGFIAQTKIFDRADALRNELQQAVEDLKADITRVEVQRKDLFEIEAAIARIKKIGDETSDKAAKFTAEKKRIDLMDADFQRIVSLSQSMELRLEQVTSSHDLLQDMQLRIRKLEEYSKDVETRYDRLEKRREVLDTTTDGVDRNFALLEKIESTVRGLDAELKGMPAEVEELRKRLKVLAQGKEDADVAVERLATLDQTLKDIEARIGRLDQAREWIAGVETRLKGAEEAAKEQVDTLQTIHKAGGTSVSKGKAADSDMRSTVLKLARQGWGKEEIARATKLSLGEVELILELGTR